MVMWADAFPQQGVTAVLEESIFIAALDKADSVERAAYLDQACGGDASLRGRVEALLQSHEGAGSFLVQPAVQTADTGEFVAGIRPAVAEQPIVETVGTCIG